MLHILTFFHVCTYPYSCLLFCTLDVALNWYTRHSQHHRTGYMKVSSMKFCRRKQSWLFNGGPKYPTIYVAKEKQKPRTPQPVSEPGIEFVARHVSGRRLTFVCV
jgi:hypothetical protein